MVDVSLQQVERLERRVRRLQWGWCGLLLCGCAWIVLGMAQQQPTVLRANEFLTAGPACVADLAQTPEMGIVERHGVQSPPEAGLMMFAFSPARTTSLLNGSLSVTDHRNGSTSISASPKGLDLRGVGVSEWFDVGTAWADFVFFGPDGRVNFRSHGNTDCELLLQDGAPNIRAKFSVEENRAHVLLLDQRGVPLWELEK